MSRTTAPLSDAACRSGKPTDRAYKLFDGNGLSLLVQPNGRKGWRLRYVKPDAEMKGQSFENVATTWHKQMSAKSAPGHSKTVMSRLKTHVLPLLGARSIAELDTFDLLQPLEAIKQRGTIDVALRVQSYLQSIMRDAKRSRLISTNPAHDLEGSIKALRVVHRPALPLSRLPELLALIDTYPGRALTRLTVLLPLNVFVRSSELRFARWSEFDLKRGTWEIPDTRPELDAVPFSTRGTKMAGDIHLAPLSPQAVGFRQQNRNLRPWFPLDGL